MDQRQTFFSVVKNEDMGNGLRWSTLFALVIVVILIVIARGDNGFLYTVFRG
jgi:hypothetical protein